MNDWQDELETICGSRELAWCEANCGEECAARAALIEERDAEGEAA